MENIIDYTKVLIIFILTFLLSFVSVLYERFLLAGYRDLVISIGVGMLIFSICIGLFFNSKIKSVKISIYSLVFILILSLSNILWIDAKFNTKKDAVLYGGIENRVNFSDIENEDEDEDEDEGLYYFGKHFMVGVTDFSEVEKLVRRKAIGGIYLTKRNFEGKTVEQIRSEIDKLQEIQKKNNLPPLLVAADHEGGLVSRLHLEPLVASSPQLSAFANQDEDVFSTDLDFRNFVYEEELVDFSKNQARELSAMGINVNLSPVIDLKFDGVDTRGTMSAISVRSIHKDPFITAEVGKIYSEILFENGIAPTLKHFPGLGNSTGETHTDNKTVLDTPITELKNHDLIPFQEIGRDTSSFIMLSHITLSDIDSDNPVSISKNVVQGLIREDMGLENVLITDDFSMATISANKYGVNGSTIKSLDAGVDIILFSYNPQLYYEAIFSSIEAYNSGVINKEKMEESSKRLDGYFEVLN